MPSSPAPSASPATFSHELAEFGFGSRMHPSGDPFETGREARESRVFRTHLRNSPSPKRCPRPSVMRNSFSIGRGEPFPHHFSLKYRKKEAPKSGPFCDTRNRGLKTNFLLNQERKRPVSSRGGPAWWSQNLAHLLANSCGPGGSLWYVALPFWSRPLPTEDGCFQPIQHLTSEHNVALRLRAGREFGSFVWIRFCCQGMLSRQESPERNEILHLST